MQTQARTPQPARPRRAAESASATAVPKTIWPGQPGGYVPQLAGELAKDTTGVSRQAASAAIARKRKSGVVSVMGLALQRKAA